MSMLSFLCCYRWWPAEVIPDRCVPSSLWSSKPTPCMFLVKFFGTDQYFWTHHGRVIAFTDDCLLEQNKKKTVPNDKTKQGQIQAQYMEGKGLANMSSILINAHIFSQEGLTRLCLCTHFKV